MSRTETATGPYCACQGCTAPGELYINHNQYGRRMVCEDHAGDHEVIAYV